MKTILAAVLFAVAGVPAAGADPAADDGLLRDARLLRFPDIHGDTIAFVYAGDIWTVPAAGGLARRITTGDGLEVFPRFSPDGKWIAFTGHYDGTSDVYVVPAEGGIPRRLTWYPARTLSERMGFDNMVIGWTPDGRILFRSQRGPIGGFVGQPYTVAPEGGPARPFPLPECGIISFSPDGKRIAYNRNFRDFRTWKRYEGGQAQDVWIYDLETKAIERITDWKGADLQPMWIGRSIYFVSDREDWKLNIWRYDVEAKTTSRVTSFAEYDVKWPHSGTGKIVFENGGWLYVLDDPAGGAPRRVAVTVPDDRKLARRRWVDVAGNVDSFGLAPGGHRAVFTARGDAFTVPAEHGNVRNITDTQGVREKDASWSPDGKWIAAVSDGTGEEELVLLPQDGKGKPVALTAGSRSFHFPPIWSPDSRKLAWAQRDMRLLYVDIEEKKPVEVDRSEVSEIWSYSWSPDSKWIAFAKAGPNGLGTIHLYSLEARAVTAVTDGTSACGEPSFDRDAGLLYFLSDRDVRPVLGALEMSFTLHRMTRPYALVLRADAPSPFAPKSDEAKLDGEAKPAEKPEKAPPAGEEKKPEKAEEKKPEFRIDLDGIADRLVVLPVGTGEYHGVAGGKGRVFYVSVPAPDGGGRPSLRVFDLEKRKDLEVLPSIETYALSPDAGRIIYRADGAWGIVDAREGAKPGDGRLDLSGMKMELDPRAEWAQIFRDCWRIDRDFFYLADMGKIDWEAVRRRYEPLVPFVSHRYDLTYVLGEMIGELASGHTYAGGGDQPHPAAVPVGALGADLEPDAKAGRWVVARVLEGQNWEEGRRSPLTEPGARVKAGEYILAIDGKDLGIAEDPSRFLVQKVGRAVTLLVGPKPERDGAREVTVRPIGGEAGLRYHDWVERNRRQVDKATGGRAGYIHIPDMSMDGLREFIRQYYPQIRKEGLIVDVRFNGGGFVSQIILERLRRVLIGMDAMRDARPDTVPAAVFTGPMVALINEYSASDGDLFPFFFRKYGLGPLIGKRTWGGVVGIRGTPGGLADGGYFNIPEFAHYGVDSQWIIENHGVDPDIEVDDLPGDVLAGRDAQLERGIAEIVKRIEERKPQFPPRPPSKDLRPPSEKKKPRQF